MSDNTYWGAVPANPELIGPGVFEDNRGTRNDKPAIWMGEALVEGTLKEWEAFCNRVLSLVSRERMNQVALERRSQYLKNIESSPVPLVMSTSTGADGRPLYLSCDSCNEDLHKCHCCGEGLSHSLHDSDGHFHDTAHCRPDLVPHDPGATCTWPSSGECYWDHDRNQLRGGTGDE